MEDRVTKEKIRKYERLTRKALAVAKKSVVSSRKEEAKEIFEMVENYVGDAKFFEKKGDYVNAFAALNYAHGWIDAGARLGIFDVKDRNLFTVR